MFWWSVAIAILFGAAVFSWIFCIQVFTHPERPLNYSLLQRFNRLEELQRFTEKTVPSGRTYEAKELYQKFYSWNAKQLAVHNSQLKRNYITNYRETKTKNERPMFVRGRFRITHARTLTPDDLFPHGVVARAVAVTENGNDFPNVVVEYVLPTAHPVTALDFNPGDLLDIDGRRQKRRLYSSVINIERSGEDVLVFTVVPLLYGEHAVDPANGRILVAEPPPFLNLHARLPFTEDPAASPLPDPASPTQSPLTLTRR